MKLVAVAASFALLLLTLGGKPEALPGPGLIRIFAITSTEYQEGEFLGARLFVAKRLTLGTGKTIGQASQECTRQLDGVTGCLATYVLPRGKIMVQGTRHQRSYYVFAVVGGTGIYSNANGTLLATTLSLNPRRERLLFSLGT